MNRQTKTLKKLGLTSLKDRSSGKGKKAPTIKPVEHGPGAFLTPDQARKRKQHKA